MSKEKPEDGGRFALPGTMYLNALVDGKDGEDGIDDEWRDEEEIVGRVARSWDARTWNTGREDGCE